MAIITHRSNDDLRTLIEEAKRASGTNRHSSYVGDVLRTITARIHHLEDRLAALYKQAPLSPIDPRRILLGDKRTADILEVKTILADATELKLDLERWASELD